MGYGAYMNVINNSSVALRTYITNVNCMYDGGGSPSNLSFFNNAVINPGDQLPGGNGEFIEAKGSGGCVFENSNFTLKITVDSTGDEVGEVNFTDPSHDWQPQSSSSNINPYVNNSGSTATIVVTIATVPAAEVATP